MKELIINCDHCGIKLDVMEDYADTEFDCIDEWFQTDLCAKCYTEISQMIKRFCGREQIH